MARCPVCNQKLQDVTMVYCGGKKCTADVKDYLPICIKCNGLAISGKTCPHDKSPHIPEEGSELMEESKRNIKV